MSRPSFHSSLLVVLTVAVTGLLVATLSGSTSAQQTSPIADSGRDVVMMRCSLADEFSTVALQSSVETPAKKGVSCAVNLSQLTKLGFQSRFIDTSDTEKGYLNMLLTR